MAGLYYVGPGQINFVVPDNAAAGPATLRVIEGSTTILSLTIQISQVAPALYAINGNGKGAAAGFLLTKDSNNKVTSMQPLFSCVSGSGTCTPNPVDTSNAQLAFLELFGTGVRNASSQTSVTATIGGVPARVIYAGPQNTYPGLDQLNVEVPSQLRGQGVVDVVITVDGKVANTLQADFK